MPLCAKITWNWILYVPVTVTGPVTVNPVAGVGTGVVNAYRFPATELATGSLNTYDTGLVSSNHSLVGSWAAVLGVTPIVTTVPVESPTIPLCAKVTSN